MIRSLKAEFTADTSARVDKAAAAFVSRSIFSRDDTRIVVNGKEVKKSFKVKEGDKVSIDYTEECFETIDGEDIPLDVLYEDSSMLVINKPSGMVVHPGAGNWSGTLVNALLYRYGEAFRTYSEEEEDNLLRPGIVHRLDKDTSGVMVIAKTALSHQNLASQFALHSNEKVYICIAKGLFTEKQGTIDKNICRSKKDRKLFDVTDNPKEGKRAITHYQVLRQSDKYAFVRVRIETGRTHQIRVHMKSIGHPLLCDALYSSKDKNFPDEALMLHAMSLTLDHPISGERMNFRAKMPTRIRKAISKLI